MTQASVPPTLGQNGTSTRPYLIRALHEWCTDNGFTPYLAVFVDASVKVPMDYVKNGEIVLNVGFEATTALELGNDLIEFKARFGGTSRDISVPVDQSEQAGRTDRGGSVLRLATDTENSSVQTGSPASDDQEPPDPVPPSGRPSLKRIK
jgi:stringent starvation protein B